MILNRKQFREHFGKIDPGWAADDSPLWIPEQYTGRKSRYFVRVSPIGNHEYTYDLWINQHCRGHVLCYYLSDTESWYGFTHKPDIVLWILKWT